jgi:hypothetical protein
VRRTPCRGRRRNRSRAAMFHVERSGSGCDTDANQAATTSGSTVTGRQMWSSPRFSRQLARGADSDPVVEAGFAKANHPAFRAGVAPGTSQGQPAFRWPHITDATAILATAEYSLQQTNDLPLRQTYECGEVPRFSMRSIDLEAGPTPSRHGGRDGRPLGNARTTST